MISECLISLNLVNLCKNACLYSSLDFNSTKSLFLFLWVRNAPDCLNNCVSLNKTCLLSTSSCELERSSRELHEKITLRSFCDPSLYPKVFWEPFVKRISIGMRCCLWDSWVEKGLKKDSKLEFITIMNNSRDWSLWRIF